MLAILRLKQFKLLVALTSEGRHVGLARAIASAFARVVVFNSIRIRIVYHGRNALCRYRAYHIGY